MMNNVTAKRQMRCQNRGVFFMVVPAIGVAVTVVVGGALALYGMEKYRNYQIAQDKIKANGGAIEVVEEKPIRKGKVHKNRNDWLGKEDEIKAADKRE